VAKSDKSAVLTHVVEVQDAETNAWFEAFVNAESGELVQVTDFVAQATVSTHPIILDWQTELNG
jgi:extracellular elastinolytic metalloproteinase